MKTQFAAGVRVRLTDGSTARISDFVKSYDWRVPGYLGDGWYQVTMPDSREVVLHEDDLILALRCKQRNRH